MRYTDSERKLTDLVAERVERGFLSVGEAVTILAKSYRLGRRHSRESIRSLLMDYRSSWRLLLHATSVRW